MPVNDANTAAAHVQTGIIAPGADTAGDGIADACELKWFGNLAAATATSDQNGDGMTDKQEYLAETNPLDPNDNLRHTHVEQGLPPHSCSYVILQWTSEPTRFYRQGQREALDPSAPWQERTTGLGTMLGWNNLGFDVLSPQCFYRVRAVRP